MARSQGKTRGSFALPRDGPSQEKIGKVGARDKQNDGDDRHEDREGVAVLRAKPRNSVCAREQADGDALNLLLPCDSDGVAFACANVVTNLTIEPDLAGGELRLAASPRDHMQEIERPRFQEAWLQDDFPDHRDRYPNLGRLQFLSNAVKLRRHYADHRKRRGVEGDGLAENGGVGGERLLPEMIADDRNRAAVRSVGVRPGNGAAK